MTVEQIIVEIERLPSNERQRVIASVRKLESDEVPADFDEAIADFNAGRFVSMDKALNEIPPKA